MTDYNGWRNKETWLVNVWFGDNWECAEDIDDTKDFIELSISELDTWIQDFTYIESIDWQGLHDSHASRWEEEDDE